MSFIYNMTDTWNAVGTTFNSILMNASNGAGGSAVGAAASRLLNLQNNGTSIFTVDIAGKTIIGTNFTVTSNSLFNINRSSLTPPSVVSSAATIMQITQADAANMRCEYNTFAGTVFMDFRRADGINGTPSAVQSGEVIAQNSYFGYGTTGYTNTAVATIAIAAAENYTDAAKGTDIQFGVTTIGTASLTRGFTIFNSTGVAINTSSDPGAGMIYTNSATFMIRTKTSYTNGAAANVGTLTNAPAVGNPTKWIPVDDNGTTRYVPSW